MTLLAVNKKGVEIACNYNLYRLGDEWTTLINDEWKYWRGEANENSDDCIVELPKGTIKKLIGRDLTWEDEPVELK